MVRMPREDKCLQRVMDKNVNKKLQQKWNKRQKVLLKI